MDDFAGALKSLCPGCDLSIEGPEQGAAFISGPGLPAVRFHFLPVSEEEEEPLSPPRPSRHMSAMQGGWISIWEDQWVRHRGVILGRVAAFMGLAKRHYARQAEVKRVNRPEAMKFLEENHLLVPIPGKYRYGIYGSGSPGNPEHSEYPGFLSLAVYSGARELPGDPPAGGTIRSFELLRFCSYRGHLVTGGLSKLLSAFIRDFKPDDIMTYIDLDWSGGASFKKLGFREEGRTAPQTFWIRPGEMVRYYPHRLPAGLQNKSAEELHQAGYYRVYNSGSLKMRLAL